MSSGGAFERIPPDLLSAFLDGEVSEEERTLAGKLLSESEQAAKELEDYRKLRALLQELPEQETLGPEFASAVLKQIEREMLLPSATERPAARGAQRWSRLVVLAATLLVAVVVAGVWVRRVHENGAARLAQSESVAQPVHVKESAREAPAATAAKVALEESASETLESEASAGPARPAPSATPSQPVAVAVLEPRTTAERLARTAAASKPTPPAASQPPAVVALDAGVRTSESKPTGAAASATQPSADETQRESSGWQLTFNQETLRTADIGQVVEALATSGDRVAVVRLTVVDKQRGLDSLQLLLARNSIAPAPERTAGPPAQAAEGMVAVYVESTSEQLAATLRQLQHEDLFRGFEVAGPIEVAQLDVPELRRSVRRLASEAKGGGRATRKAAAKGPSVAARGPSARAVSPASTKAAVAEVAKRQKTAARELSESKGRQRGVSKPPQPEAFSLAEAAPPQPPSPLGRRSTEPSAQAKPSAGVVSASRQVAMVLPPSLAEQLRRLGLSGEKGVAPEARGVAKASPEQPFRVRARVCRPGGEPLRVLFVLVPVEPEGQNGSDS